MSLLKEMYQYRELLKTTVKKDIRGKYKGSLLGVFWSFLSPLLQVFVYYLVFPYLMGNTVDNYLIYLITGLIPWTFFLSVIQSGTRAIKENGGIIKKVYFPRELLMISQVVSGLINFFISCIIILLFCIFAGVGIGWQLVLVPVVALIQAILSLGLIFILGSVNVYIQDVEYLIQFVLQMGFYATPVIYSLSQFANAGWLLKLIALNPLTVLLEAYRDCFLYHVWPDWNSLGLVSLFSLAILAAGYWIFKKLEKGFAEEL